MPLLLSVLIITVVAVNVMLKIILEGLNYTDYYVILRNMSFL